MLGPSNRLSEEYEIIIPHKFTKSPAGHGMDYSNQVGAVVNIPTEHSSTMDNVPGNMANHEGGIHK